MKHAETPEVTPELITLADHNNVFEDTIDIDISGCGDTKGCYWEPKDCVYGTNCDVLVTWKENGDHFLFETDYVIAAEFGDSFWSAVGFSQDTFMVFSIVIF